MVLYYTPSLSISLTRRNSTTSYIFVYFFFLYPPLMDLKKIEIRNDYTY